jgi:predicted RecB family endonuclease
VKEPRYIQNPNGGVLCVDVTMLQLGLCQCRSIATRTLQKKGVGVDDLTAALNEVIERVKTTMYDVQEYESENEVESLVRHIKNDKTTQ